MKKLQHGTLALMIALSVGVYSCGPNSDGGGMDEKNSSGEGAIDSTRLTNFDTSMGYISVPKDIHHSADKN